MSELSENKRRLLEQRLGRRAATAARAPEAIPPRVDGPVPLSSGQRALLYEHRLRSDVAIYNVVFCYALSGPFDLDRFEAAVHTVVTRHEPLRTTFGADRRNLDAHDAVEVLRIEATPDEFDDVARRDALRRFDLDEGPLVRLTTAAFDPERHGVIIALHHVSSDAASLSNLWNEIDLAYHDEPLPILRTDYSSHAEWQLEQVSETDRTFWRDHLGLDAKAVELPLERPKPVEGDGYLSLPLSIDTTSMQDHGTRPTPFFLSVFAALLQRYTDTDDVVVGVAASTRGHPHVDDLIGYFLTMLPLRLPIDPSSTTAATARSIDELLGSSLPHRHVPYSMIASDRRREGAEEPDPIRAMFVYDEPHRMGLRGIDVTGHIVHPGASVTDLTLFARPTAGGFEISVEWSGERFRLVDVDRFANEFGRMAEWAIRHPGSPWSALPHPPDQSGGPLRTELRPLPKAIEEQVGRTPNAPAVRSGHDQMTYAELWAKSARLAGGLQALGIGRGHRVAIVLPRGIDAIATIIAVHRLAATHVPIDPSYPEERIELILRQAEATAVVTDSATEMRLHEASVLVSDLENSSTIESPVAAQLDDLAYVIFTSGSTGVPRGVAVDHRRLAASTTARLDWYETGVGTFLMPSSLGFDSSVAGIFWTLATGGQLVLPTEAEVHDIDALAVLTARTKATHTLMVPSLYRALLVRDPGSLDSLRCVIVAGEVCPSSLVDLHTHHLPSTPLFNEYGPTEATVWATAHQCMTGESPVPIGKPIPGTVIRIVDRWLRPRPHGAIGQLAIGGAGVTDGYADDQALTERKFVGDPASGHRFYLSGDLARVDDAGRICFIGRADHQASLGGVRVEPEEIEAVLLSSAGVTGALVRVERQLTGDPIDAFQALDTDRASEICRLASVAEDPASALLNELAKHGDGSDVLVAYVEGAGLDEGELRNTLSASLPGPLVPHTIDFVDVLARSEHGKVDRGALPPPWRRRVVQRMSDAANDLTSRIARMFNIVLDRTDIGPDSDFFEAGGDSLRAVELVTALEDELGRRIPISALVLGRSPRQLAALIGTPSVSSVGGDTVRTSHVVPLNPGGPQPPLLIMPPGGGNLIAFDPLVQAMGDRFPLLGFDLPGADRDRELPTSVEQLCDTYLPQLKAAVPTGPYRLLGWSFGGVVALELAQRLREGGDEVELVAMIDTLVPGYQRAKRLRIYREMARNGDALGIAELVVRRIRNRLRIRSTTKRGNDATEVGAALPPEDRDLWLTIKIDQIVERHRSQPYEGRVVYFAASDTFAWRTTEPWSELLSDFEVIQLDGSHDGDESLLSGDRAARIAAELSSRLS